MYIRGRAGSPSFQLKSPHGSCSESCCWLQGWLVGYKDHFLHGPSLRFRSEFFLTKRTDGFLAVCSAEPSLDHECASFTAYGTMWYSRYYEELTLSSIFSVDVHTLIKTTTTTAWEFSLCGGNHFCFTHTNCNLPKLCVSVESGGDLY